MEMRAAFFLKKPLSNKNLKSLTLPVFLTQSKSLNSSERNPVVPDSKTSH